MSDVRAELADHRPIRWRDFPVTRPALRNRRITACMVLRPHAEDELRRRALYAPGRPLTAKDAKVAHAPHPRFVGDLARYLSGYGLECRASGMLPLVHVEGPVAAVEAAFRIGIRTAQAPAGPLYAPDRSPSLPSSLAEHVVAVVGLDNLGRPHRQRGAAHGAAFAGYLPEDLLLAYQVPKDAWAVGERLAVLEFGSRFSRNDIQDFWAGAGRAPGRLEAIDVSGAQAEPPGIWDLEATLDVEWAGAVAQGAALTVIEAPGPDQMPFPLAHLLAQERVLSLDPLPAAVSVSYGDGESSFAPAVLEAWDLLFAWGHALGVEWFCASGDQGAYGLHGQGLRVRHADAPATSPHVVAVGGTRLVARAGRVESETGWGQPRNPADGASGGGLSALFGRPSFQSSAALEAATGQAGARGVPDVAANADPQTGYRVEFEGASVVVGGTSAAAPVWAGIATLLSAARKEHGRGPIAPLAPRLYALPAGVGLRDVQVGDNTYAGVEGYHCVPGWDAVTGLGTPVGRDLWRELAGAEVAPLPEEQFASLVLTTLANLNGEPEPVGTDDPPTEKKSDTDDFPPKAVSTP